MRETDLTNKAFNIMDGAPKHVETEKTCYQGRHVIKENPQHVAHFHKTASEGHSRELEHGTVMTYTDINDKPPTGNERGTAIRQSTMGAGPVDFNPRG